jgi:hypothetical protein
VWRLVDAGTLKTTLAESFGTISAANLRRAHALIESRGLRARSCRRAGSEPAVGDVTTASGAAIEIVADPPFLHELSDAILTHPTTAKRLSALFAAARPRSQAPRASCTRFGRQERAEASICTCVARAIQACCGGGLDLKV